MTSQKQYYKNARIDEEKVAACPDVNSPNDMEEGVSEKKMTITATPPDDMEEGEGDEKDEMKSTRRGYKIKEKNDFSKTILQERQN